MAIRNVSFDSIKNSAGDQSSPSSGTVMADTGALAAGMYEVRCTVTASAAAQFAFQYRDVGNANTLFGSTLIIPANSFGQALFELAVNTTERLRIVMNADLTGTGSASITAKKVA